MALTRKFLKALGIEGELAEQVIEAHAGTVDALKEQLAAYKAEAEKPPAVQKELNGAQKALDDAGAGGWQARHDALKKEFEGYKAEVAARQARALKEKAARAYYEGRGIRGKALEIALRGSGAEIEALELEGGGIKDASALDALIEGDFAGLVSATVTRGAATAHPPAGGGPGRKTREEIMAIPDRQQRRAEIARHLELF